jgi:CheY-like chemotaxis protein
MSLNILIVDDSKLARMAVTKAVRSLHPEWTTVEAAGAKDAIAAIRTGAPDVAVMDFNMPEKDGLALAAEIREISPNMPLAVISANHQQQIIDRARAVGASFLPKPLTERELGEFLDAAVIQLKGSGS